MIYKHNQHYYEELILPRYSINMVPDAYKFQYYQVLVAVEYQFSILTYTHA